MYCWIMEKVEDFKSRFAQAVLSRVSQQAVSEALVDYTVRRRLWDGWTLVRTFLCQVASGESCREAVERAIQQQWVVHTASVNTAGYCMARQRLPEQPLRELALQTGHALHQQSRDEEAWQGRAIKVVDGSGLSLPDTPANQQAYPQPPGQKPGCGFPLMYVCALMGLAGGAILDAVTGGGSGSERRLFRQLWRGLQRDDILLADAGFGSYAEIVCLLRRGVDTVVRLGARRANKGRMEQLGAGDWLVEWRRPRQPGDWTRAAQLPVTLLMRVVEFRIEQRGFRTRKITLATTLLDVKRYPKGMLAELYRRRWEMELRLRDIKTTMGLEELRCKSPIACRRELWMGLLAYNLIRTVMMDAARSAGVSPAQISFAGTVQRLAQFGAGALLQHSPRKAYRMLLEHLAQDRLPHRPNRREPRAIKRRPKNYQLLTAPRHEFRECPHRNRYRKALT